MRREENGHFLVLTESADDIPQKLSRLRVKSGGRLVENEYLRLVQQGAGNVYPAALTAGELAYASVEQVLEIEKPCKLVKPFVKCPAGYAVQRGAAFEVFAHRERFVEHAALKHDSKPAGYLGNVLAGIERADLNAAAVGFQLTAHDGYGGALSGTVYAEEGKQLALTHIERQVAHRVHIPERLV